MKLAGNDSHRSWPLYVLAAPATVAVWSGWVGLGEKTGFGKVHPLPGIADHFSINTAITLPIGVEAYAAYALGAWLSKKPLSDGTRSFARTSAIGALVLGALGQIAYHLLEVSKHTHAPIVITMLVACLPVAVLGMGATLAHLIHRDGTSEPNGVRTPELVLETATKSAGQATSKSVTYASDPEAQPDAGQVTPKPLPQATPAPVTQATGQATSAELTQSTGEPPPSKAAEVTRKTAAKSPSKAAAKSRRSDDELKIELDKIVAEHYRTHPGEEIKVQPVAKQLGIGRDRARTLLDQMNVRPIRREATG